MDAPTNNAKAPRGPIVPESLIMDPRLEKLTGRDLRVLLCLLASRNRRTGLCCPRQKTIADKLGLKARQRVAESIRSLKRSGLLEVAYGWTKKARRKITSYSFPHLDHCPDEACNGHANKCPEKPCNPPADKGTDSGDNCPGNPCRQMHGLSGHSYHGRGTTEVLNHTPAAKPPLSGGEILARLKKRGVTETMAKRMIAENPQRALAAADTASRFAEKSNRPIGGGLVVNWFRGTDDPPDNTGGLLSNREYYAKLRTRLLGPEPAVEQSDLDIWYLDIVAAATDEQRAVLRRRWATVGDLTANDPLNETERDGDLQTAIHRLMQLCDPAVAPATTPPLHACGASDE